MDFFTFFTFFVAHTYIYIKTHLVEAAMEDSFDFSSFKGDGLEVSFVVIIEKRQGLSRVCGGTELAVREERKR